MVCGFKLMGSFQHLSGTVLIHLSSHDACVGLAGASWNWVQVCSPGLAPSRASLGLGAPVCRMGTELLPPWPLVRTQPDLMSEIPSKVRAPEMRGEEPGDGSSS